MTTVREVMHKGVVTCAPSTQLSDVAALLHTSRIHAAFVAEDGKPATGVVADMDLLAGEWLSTDATSFDAMRQMTAGELASQPVKSIDADENVAVAAENMRRDRIARLLVTDGGRPVGVIATADLIGWLANVAPHERGSVRDAMSWGFVACVPSTPILAIVRSMAERRSRSVVVLGDGRSAAGVVTGTDLLPLVAGQMDPSLRAQDVMHSPITIPIDASLRAAADKMISHEIHRLVVVDPAAGDAIAGLISTTDIVAEMSGPGSAWR